MKHVAVIGAGAMGSGIAQIAAMHGCEVKLFDSFPDAIGKAKGNIDSSLVKLDEKGKLKENRQGILNRITFADHLGHIAGCDLVIEAIIENENEKRVLLEGLADFVGADTIVATNTSSLSVTSLARYTEHPEKFIGIHFFNPPVLMALVEIIPALQTNPSIISEVEFLIQSWGKTTVIAKDTPGFIVNRIARPFYSEALRIAEEQIAPPDVIDAAMKTFGGFRMGPFELMDFIGHDVNYAVTQSVWASTFFEPRYKPSTLQGNLVRAGWVGRKSGRGFYTYGDDVQKNIPEVKEDHRYIFDRILVMLINEAADALYHGIASREDIDLAMTRGVNYPKGLLQWADEVGIDNCVKQMDELFAVYHEERYRCSRLLREMLQTNSRFADTRTQA